MDLFSNESEQYLIACVLLDRGRSEISEYILTTLEWTDFHYIENKIIFNAMQNLHAKSIAIDCATVAHQLNESGQLSESGGMDYLTKLKAIVPSKANYKQYRDNVKDLSYKRDYIDFSKYIAMQAESGLSIDELRSDFDSQLSKIATKEIINELKPIVAGVDIEIERMKKAASGKYESFGIRTGFELFDECTWGMRPGNVTVIAARPGGGKTDFGLDSIYNAAIIENKICALFSLEMSTDEVVRRLLSIGGALDSTAILSGKIMDTDESTVKKIRGLLANDKLFIDDTTNQTPQQIFVKCRRLKRKHGLDLVVIDYLGIMKPPRNLNNPVAETGELIRAVKFIARELQVPILCLCQMNRNIEREKDGKPREPMMSDLRGSGEIEQEAAVIAFLNLDDKPDEIIREAKIKMVKNRHGRMKNIDFSFQGNIHTFREVCFSAPTPKVKTKSTIKPVQDELPFDPEELEKIL